MLMMIGQFKFEINKTDFEELETTLTFDYAELEKIGAHSSFQAVGKYKQEDSIKGELICKSQSQLKAFADMAKQMKPQTLALPTGEAYTVLIFSIRKTKKNFLKTGEFLKQSYSISLKRVEP